MGSLPEQCPLSFYSRVLSVEMVTALKILARESVGVQICLEAPGAYSLEETVSPGQYL